MAIFHRNDPSAFENHNLCKKCGGKCCKYSPCMLHADDIKDKSPEGIVDAVYDKNLTLNALLDPNLYKEFEYFEFPYYFVSSATILAPRVNLLDITGECANLTPKGCKFDSKERPTGGKLLVPNKNFDCHYEDRGTVKRLIYSWYEFQDSLKEATEILTEGRIGETKSKLYTELVNSSDDLQSYGYYNGTHYRMSYLYCLLANEFGLKLEPEAMYTINTFVTKFPECREEIIDYVKNNPGNTSYSELVKICFR